MTSTDAAGLFQIVWIGLETKAKTMDASFHLSSVVDRSAAESWFQWFSKDVDLNKPGELRRVSDSLKERLLAEWLEKYRQ